ncbi:divergent polysaccharide deacetylase family protein [Hoeflea sp.]|uniref:divergent polysaccharide deacetylase family protein n=1 Tax=Hoeflea sp. TaxID=1940281 RepID=UPI00374808C1
MGNDIHKPLGTNARPPVKNQAVPAAGWISRLAVGLVLAAIVGGAGWIAFSGSEIKRSGLSVVANSPESDTTSNTIDVTSAQEQTDGRQSGQSDTADAPLQALHGQSGAEVVKTLDDDGNEIVKITPAQRQDNRPVLLTPPDRVGQNPRLAHLPDPSVIEETDAGELPVRGENGERPFDIYARPWSGTRGARVVIIVGGLGLSQTGTQHAIAALPEDITLAFAANGNSLQRWMQEARREGHEILLQVPFEPFDYPANDPGPRTLTVDAGADANLDRLHASMARITNYTGITNFMGGRFLSNPDALEPVMRDLANRGLMFLDDGTSAQSLTDRFSKTLGIPFAAADMVLDATQERGYILAKLDDLERSARRNGVAIGVASAFEVSVDAIASWANEAKARGIEIVSASAAAEDPER